jgi:hypothetical protein
MSGCFWPNADRQFREYMLIRTAAIDESRHSRTQLKFSSNHRLSNVRFGPGSGHTRDTLVNIR